jgi:hypothetical protein
LLVQSGVTIVREPDTYVAGVAQTSVAS